MSLNAALVDRARQLRREPLARRVEGRTQFATTTGEWFRCRLTVNSIPETADAASAHSRDVVQAQLLCGLRDRGGQALALASTDKLDVDSKNLGRQVYEVVTDPKPIRKKRSVIGYRLTLKQIGEHAFTQAAP